MSGPRYAQPIPSLVHLRLPVLRPWITPVPPQFHPKRLAFAMAQPFMSSDWLRKPSTGGSPGSQELRRASCGYSHCERQRMPAYECLVSSHPLPISHDPTASRPCASSGGSSSSSHPVMTSTYKTPAKVTNSLFLSTSSRFSD